MGLSVSSWFWEQLQAKTSAPIRRFYLQVGSTNAQGSYNVGTMDLSSYVRKWPRFKSQGNRFAASNVVMDLTNAAQALNLLHDDPLSLVRDGSLHIGFTHPTSGDELATLFKGNVIRVEMNEQGVTKVNLSDRWNRLTHVTMGTDDSPVDYTGSSYLAHDLAWYLVTSHGGFSSIESTSNPDIDWAAFTSWTSVFSGDNTRMQAYFTGEKISDALAALGKATDSDIFTDASNRMTFTRWSLAGDAVLSLDQSLCRLGVSIDEADTINSAKVTAAYNVDSEEFGITVHEQSSSSVNSFGLYEQVLADSEIVWLVNSSSAINLSQRTLNLYNVPKAKPSASASLQGMLVEIGEMVYLSSQLHGIGGAYRVREKSLDMQKGEVKLIGDLQTVQNGFILDVSSLDGTEVLL